MLLENAVISPTHYQAEAAYQSRSFARQKRYTMQEITAFIVHPQHPHRAEVEAFIHEVFQQAYGANVTHFMPILVALRNSQHELVAAFGMRDAKSGPLFLEQYLDAPIEQVISTGLGQAIQRDEITEIGNLAVANPRNAGILIAHVIQQSLDMGVRWCVATAHHSLQNSLIKGGRDVYPIALADKSRLTAQEQAQWGRYYDNQPQIVAVRGVA
jgi:hypothetical protein